MPCIEIVVKDVCENLCLPFLNLKRNNLSRSLKSRFSLTAKSFIFFYFKFAVKQQHQPFYFSTSMLFKFGYFFHVFLIKQLFISLIVFIVEIARELLFYVFLVSVDNFFNVAQCFFQI